MGSNIQYWLVVDTGNNRKKSDRRLMMASAVTSNAVWIEIWPVHIWACIWYLDGAWALQLGAWTIVPALRYALRPQKYISKRRQHILEFLKNVGVKINLMYFTFLFQMISYFGNGIQSPEMTALLHTVGVIRDSKHHTNITPPLSI